MKIPNKTIVVEVLDGAVVNVFANGNQSVLVVDHDTADGTPPKYVWVATEKPSKMDAGMTKIVTRKLKDLAK